MRSRDIAFGRITRREITRALLVAISAAAAFFGCTGGAAAAGGRVDVAPSELVR